MKTFKQHINEKIDGVGTTNEPHSVDGGFNIHDPQIMERVNAFVGVVANQEYMNPKAAMEQLANKLTTIGLSFDMPEMVNGKAEAVVSQHGGRFGKDLDGSDINDDGISHRKEGGLKISFKSETLENGSSKVYAKLV